MKLFKRWTKLKTLILVLIVCAVTAAGYGVFVHSNNKPEPVTVSYTGSNGSYSIIFTRFTNYDTYLKEKSSYIIEYNDKSEIHNPPGSGYIAGEVVFNGIRELNKCEIELIRESKWNTNAIAFNMQPDTKESPVNMVFAGGDFPDSKRDIYKTAILHFDNKKVEIPLTKSWKSDF